MGSPGFDGGERGGDLGFKGYEELKDGSVMRTETEIMGAVRYKDADGRRRDRGDEEEQGIVKSVVVSQRSCYGG